MANSLFTFAEFSDLMSWSKPTESEYPDYVIIKDLVKARIEDFLKRKLDEVTATETVEAYTSMIPLQRLPISTITLVQSDIQNTITTIDSADYVKVPYGIKLLNYEVSEGEKIKVSYTGGYSVTSSIIAVPDGIKRAAMYQTKYEVESKSQLGAESIQTDVGTIKRPPMQLLRELRETLQPYIHPYHAIGIA